MSKTVHLRWGHWAGLLGPALFVCTFVVEGWLRPGYDARTRFVSELALGEWGWVQVLNFLMLGLALLVLAVQVRAELGAGSTLLAVMGVLLTFSGLFVMDPVETPREALSVSGLLHNLLGALFFSFAPVTCLVVWHRLRWVAHWRTLSRWSLSVGVALVMLIVAWKALNTWVGVFQRVSLISFLAWVSAVGWQCASGPYATGRQPPPSA